MASEICMECQCSRCGNMCCEDPCNNSYGCDIPNTKCQDFIVPNQYGK